MTNQAPDETPDETPSVPTHDPESLMNAALDTRRGLRVTFPDRAAAERFRNRCYKVKRREAERARKDLGIAETEWDMLTFRTAGLPDGELRIVPGAPDVQSVEEL